MFFKFLGNFYLTKGDTEFYTGVHEERLVAQYRNKPNPGTGGCAAPKAGEEAGQGAPAEGKNIKMALEPGMFMKTRHIREDDGENGGP